MTAPPVQPFEKVQKVVASVLFVHKRKGGREQRKNTDSFTRSYRCTSGVHLRSMPFWVQAARAHDGRTFLNCTKGLTVGDVSVNWLWWAQLAVDCNARMSPCCEWARRYNLSPHGKRFTGASVCHMLDGTTFWMR